MQVSISLRQLTLTVTVVLKTFTREGAKLKEKALNVNTAVDASTGDRKSNDMLHFYNQNTWKAS